MRLPVVAAGNQTGSYALPNAEIVTITATGNLTLTGGSLVGTAGEWDERVISVTASGADRTVTAGSGITGVNTPVTVTSGTTREFSLVGNGGVWTLYGGISLNDIAPSTSTALGVGSIELGHATDTTISRVSAGVVSVEGKNIALQGTSEAWTTGTVELGHATDTTLSRTAAGQVAVEGVAVCLAGKQTVWVPAAAMKPATTSGAATGTYESTTNKVNIEVLDFDGAADEYGWFTVAFPKGWNESTVTFQAFWFSSATDTDSCIWGLAGVAVSDNETLDVALGTAVTVTDNAQSAANELYVSAESSAVTIAGTPAEGDLVAFRVFRDADTDTMTEDARLVGIKLFFTTNAANDA